METFWVATLFHLQPSPSEWESIETLAMNDCGALGIEEYSLSEPEVDAILGERSYSGGDLPLEVLDEVEGVIHNKPQNYRFFFNDQDSGNAFLREVKKISLCETQLEEKQSEDWNAEWKKHYSPIRVNEELTIVPAWEKEFKGTSKLNIFINPGMGFGTGSHETTFLCLKIFTEKVLGHKVDKVLDFGSGSGILGLAALKFFPDSKVDFYDIDIEANKNCYQNAELNHLQDRAFRLLLPEVRNLLLENYEVVFANILENILILENKALKSFTAKGGYLIVSGLLKHQAKTIIDLYQDTEFTLLSEEYLGDWSALCFKRKDT